MQLQTRLERLERRTGAGGMLHVLEMPAACPDRPAVTERAFRDAGQDLGPADVVVTLLRCSGERPVRLLHSAPLA